VGISRSSEGSVDSRSSRGSEGGSAGINRGDGVCSSDGSDVKQIN
jgi:hypothetical protein